MEREINKPKSIREVFGRDVNEIIQFKSKEMDAMFSVSEPIKGIKIIKNEYLIYKEKRRENDRN